MKKFLSIISLFTAFVGFTQVPTYYSGIDFNQSSATIYSQLASLVTTTHNQITYSQCWDALKEADLETGATGLVALIYGFDDSDGNPVTDRTRGVNLNGGNAGEWNREHVFPKSLGSPDLGTDGPGADAHNLRASDVTQNGNRANKKFTTSSGTAGSVSSNWYPGDEWKGDCARIIMYMYLRYNTRCIPADVGTGSLNSVDPNMANIFLDWNYEDPVSQFERDRNDAIQDHQGNRNPFIDNPRIAFKLWGGPLAPDTWGTLGAKENEFDLIEVYPSPVTEDIFYVSGLNTLDVSEMNMYSISGQLIKTINVSEIVNNGGISVDHLQPGTYLLSLIVDNQAVKRKVVVQ